MQQYQEAVNRRIASSRQADTKHAVGVVHEPLTRRVLDTTGGGAECV